MNYIKNIKKYMLYMALPLAACTQADDGAPEIGNPPSNVNFKHTANENVITFTAEATGAFQYYWTFGDKTYGAGDTISHPYEDPGEYTISLTAFGKGGQTTMSKLIKVDKGNPEKFSAFNILLSGYDPDLKKSTKVWVWDTLAGASAVGPPAAGSYFDPIDDSWWRAEANSMNASCYDDEYSFILETSEYIHKPGETFYYNWAWANELRGLQQAQWADTALPYTPPAATWKIKNHIKDNDTARVIELTNGAWLGLANGAHAYHVISLSADTMWVRYDNSTPAVFNPAKTVMEWGYLRLVTKK